MKEIVWKNKEDSQIFGEMRVRTSKERRLLDAMDNTACRSKLNYNIACGSELPKPEYNRMRSKIPLMVQ
jgi:hypothetical protein